MKRFALLLFAVASLIFTSCGVGSYSVSSGKADKCAVCFVADGSYDITVTIDGTTYSKQTIKQKTYKKRRNIKKVAVQQIVITPGKHTVNVMRDGQNVYSQSIFISASEVRIIEL